MKIQTFSVVVGGKKCNAHCPYCVSKMTGLEDCSETGYINERNFHKACQFAKQSGVSTVLLTGKGEPTLYMNQIDRYLNILEQYDFPFIELQTNGMDLPLHNEELFNWYNKGMTTVCLSCAHWLTDRNREIFGELFEPLEKNINRLHRAGLSVRASCVMCKDYIDNASSVGAFALWCKEHKVEQFTARPVGIDENSDNEKIKEWVREHSISKIQQKEVETLFEKVGFLLLELAHGAKVYDYYGQKVSINSCLTHSPDPDDIRQLIFSPDGHLRYSWVYDGAIII